MRKKADFRLYQKPKAIQFTKEGLEDVKRKYQALKDERPDAVMHLKKSRELGDLSENGYYKASRFRLSHIDAQLLRLGHMIKYAVISEPTQSDTVQLGSTVLLETGGEQVTYTIVGKFEADPTNKKISEVSPLGSQLMGKKVNDEVTIEAPSRKTVYKILTIS